MAYHLKSRIELCGVSQTFSQNAQQVQLFQDLTLTIAQGHSYAITGPSGSGKSSLLMLLSGLAQPSTGQGYWLENDSRRPLAGLAKEIGYIFQQFHLLPELTALHNVALPLKLRGVKHAEQLAKSWLDKVGLGHRLQHKPAQLSGGEQQRTAIARALVFSPKFIFADEPTGNLDSQNAQDIADLLFACCEEQGAGLVIVTHSELLAARAEQIFNLAQGHCQLRQSKLQEVYRA
ncbi:ABC transporter ATP-binding protein [Alishewanella longhuensis]|uniref:ABC transporter ATP-binding protein n=1 Tax=Alishewanella longhuensis TaxID=1091037 RepID=A0ABQ3KXI0_9ALTE|nr:ATP-binding cassette domain-containing protein [Alishewanella longhuensis]GHG63307.1 ABC transporter ATP-binding protein [Alishewanella longhuensis]